MAEFFNSNQKTVYARVETADGKVKLGLNEPLSQDGDFNDVISMTELRLDVRSDVVMIDVAIEVLAGAWTNRNFDDIIEPLVEEPYRTSPQRPEDREGQPADPQRGVWVIQFGWRNQAGEDVLSHEIECVTVHNDLSILPEARGAVQIRKTMIMLPATYLNQTMLSDLNHVNEYLSTQTTDAENDAPVNITAREVFRLLVEDLKALHGTKAPGLPTLANFVGAGDNFLNISAPTAYSEWLDRPLKNITVLNQVLTSEKKDITSVRRWLADWLHDNQMEIFLVPLRKFNGGLGFLIRYAAKDSDPEPTESSVETYQASLDPNLNRQDTYRYAWKPTLDILARDGILENASFSYDAGNRSAGYIEAFQRYTSKLHGQEAASQQVAGSDVPEKAKEQQSEETVNTRALFMEILKLPNKKVALTIMGQPKVSIMDLVAVDASNPLFTGIYEVLGIGHQINTQGFTTELDCIRIDPNLTRTIPNIENGEIRE